MGGTTSSYSGYQSNNFNNNISVNLSNHFNQVLSPRSSISNKSFNTNKIVLTETNESSLYNNPSKNNYINKLRKENNFYKNIKNNPNNNNLLNKSY
jgi:hypothetical protein